MNQMTEIEKTLADQIIKLYDALIELTARVEQIENMLVLMK